MSKIGRDGLDKLKGKRDEDEFPTLQNTTPLQQMVRGGPRKPQPFPSSGDMEKLINCPRCKHKRVPFWYAPYERAYETECLNCGQAMVIRDDSKPLSVIMQEGGFTPTFFDDVTWDREEGVMKGDATGHYEHVREKQDLGVQEAHTKGLLPSMGAHN